jgi:hypothetical protein
MNIRLGGLNCSNNQLTSLDVSKNNALNTLVCSNNQLTSLDVSKSASLYRLDCSNNQLTTLDVSQNTRLIELSCYDNQLTSIASLVANSILKRADVRNNKLDCRDWEDVKIMRARMGEAVFVTDMFSGDMYLSSGFVYSPQKGLDPYNCEPIDNWTEYESIK